jgi:arylamine N-acetyltransferase
MARGLIISHHLPIIYAKVVDAGRGGVCYELNQLFNWLLNQLGYTARLVESNVYSSTTRSYFPFYVHIAILVNGLADTTATYITDVGFSFGYTEPLIFELETIQNNSTGIFRFAKQDEANQDTKHNNVFLLSRLQRDENDERENPTYTWTPVYIIDLAVVDDVTRFEKPFLYVQSAECPRFYNRTIAVRHVDQRILILAGYSFTCVQFIDGLEQKRESRALGSAQEVRDVMRGEFDLQVDDDFEPRQIDRD